MMLLRTPHLPNACIDDGKDSTVVLLPQFHQIEAKARVFRTYPQFLDPLVEEGDGQETTCRLIANRRLQVSIQKVAEGTEELH